MLLESFPIMLVFSKSREARNSSGCFSSKLVTIKDICKEIRALEASKATQNDAMPTKIIKNNSDIFLEFFKRILTKFLKQVLSPSN